MLSGSERGRDSWCLYCGRGPADSQSRADYTCPDQSKAITVQPPWQPSARLACSVCGHDNRSAESISVLCGEIDRCDLYQQESVCASVCVCVTLLSFLQKKRRRRRHQWLISTYLPSIYLEAVDGRGIHLHSYFSVEAEVGMRGQRGRVGKMRGQTTPSYCPLGRLYIKFVAWVDWRMWQTTGSTWPITTSEVMWSKGAQRLWCVPFSWNLEARNDITFELTEFQLQAGKDGDHGEHLLCLRVQAFFSQIKMNLTGGSNFTVYMVSKVL